MNKLMYCNVRKDNHLNMYESSVKPSRLMEDAGLEDVSSITGIEFVYQTSDGIINEETKQRVIEEGFSQEISELAATNNETFYSEFYFIGDVVEFEEVKLLLKKDVDLSKYKDKKIAISYRDGEIFDMRPIFDDRNKVYAVQSLEELASIYSEKTGVEFPKHKSI